MLSWLLGVIISTPLVILDPGHGGDQLGASSVCGLLEKNVTLDLSRRIRALLKESGRVDVEMTRDEDFDLELSKRAQIANDKDAALLISVHANWSPSPKARGLETYVVSFGKTHDKDVNELVAREEGTLAAPPEPTKTLVRSIVEDLERYGKYDASLRAAQSLQSELVTGLDRRDRGIFQAPFAVLRRSQVPAVLVEVGFLSHPEECKALSTDKYRAQIAKSLSAGILYYFETLSQ